MQGGETWEEGQDEWKYEYAHEWTGVTREAGVVAFAFEDEINLL